MDFNISRTSGQTPETIMSVGYGGNVGIGTTSPGGKLHVLDGTAGTYTPYGESDTLVVESATPGGISLIGTGTGGNSKQSIVFGTSSDVTMASIIYDGNNSFLSIGTTTTSNFVKFTSGNGVEAMRITAGGNVGIGTTTPNVGRLEVGGASPTLAINSSTNTDPTLFLLRNGGANGIGLLKVRDGGHLSFDTGATGAAQSEKMRITSAGGVSFGSTGTAYGTSGQVLTSAGNASPTWTTPSSGGGIGGSIASTQLAFGSATADEITGSAEATFLESAGKTLLQVGSTGGKAQSIININQTNNDTSRARLELSRNTSTRGFLGIEYASTDVTLYSNDNLVLDSDGDDVIITTQSTSNVGVGNTTPDHKLDVTGRIKASKGLQVGEETSTAANAASEGTIRYRGAISVGSKTVSVVEMCMQVSATPTYAWEVIYTTAGWV